MHQQSWWFTDDNELSAGPATMGANRVHFKLQYYREVGITVKWEQEKTGITDALCYPCFLRLDQASESFRIAHLLDLPNLRWISLAYTGTSDAELDQFSDMRQLRFLVLTSLTRAWSGCSRRCRIVS